MIKLKVKKSESVPPKIKVGDLFVTRSDNYVYMLVEGYKKDTELILASLDGLTAWDSYDSIDEAREHLSEEGLTWYSQDLYDFELTITSEN